MLTVCGTFVPRWNLSVARMSGTKCCWRRRANRWTPTGSLDPTPQAQLRNICRLCCVSLPHPCTLLHSRTASQSFCSSRHTWPLQAHHLPPHMSNRVSAVTLIQGWGISQWLLLGIHTGSGLQRQLELLHLKPSPAMFQHQTALAKVIPMKVSWM